jgi:hypothetical protein
MKNLETELIAAIQNEELYFGMEVFFRPGTPKENETCHTASCMAGHILALRPEQSKRIRRELEDGDPDDYACPSRVASTVWERELGEPCRLDFYGYKHKHKSYEMRDITRREAVLHILGDNPEWPQLEDDELDLNE